MTGIKVALDVTVTAPGGHVAQGSSPFSPAPVSASTEDCLSGNCHSVVRGSELCSSTFYQLTTAWESTLRSALPLAKGHDCY